MVFAAGHLRQDDHAVVERLADALDVELEALVRAEQVDGHHARIAQRVAARLVELQRIEHRPLLDVVVAVHLQHVGRALVARVHHPVIAVLLQHAQAGVVRRQGELAACHGDDIGVDLDRRDARGRQVAMAEPRGRPRPHAQLHYVEIAFRGRLQEQQPGHLLVDVFEIEGIRIGQPQGALRHPFAADEVHEAVPLFLDDGDRRQRGHGACGSLRRHGGGREVRINLGRCGAQKCHGGRSCGVKSRSEVVGDAPRHWAGRASAWAQLAICRPAPVFPASAARPWVRVGLRVCGSAPETLPGSIQKMN